MTTLPISKIQSWVAQRRLDPRFPITVRELVASKCISMPKDGVKLLASSRSHDMSLDAQGPLSQPLHIVVSRASASAIAAVEKAGGKVTTRYYTKWAIQQICKGKMDPMKSLKTDPAGPEAEAVDTQGEVIDYEYRLPDATSRKAIEYYRDPAHRGYLNYTIEEGQGPSLFFRPPVVSPKEGLAKKGAKTPLAKDEKNKIW
jgi:large subunit ribosomal protein L15